MSTSNSASAKGSSRPSGERKVRRVAEVAPADAFVTDSDQWAVSKTDYDCLLEVANELEDALNAERLMRQHYETRSSIASPDVATLIAELRKRAHMLRHCVKGSWKIDREDVAAAFDERCADALEKLSAIAPSQWHYGKPKRDEKDCRRLVSMEQHGMQWIGIRAWNHDRQCWMDGSGSEPEQATVVAWQWLPEPAWLQGSGEATESGRTK